MNKIIEFDINESIEDENTILKIEELCRNNVLLDIPSIEVLLRNLSCIVRRKIADCEGIKMSEYSYSNKCDLAQSMIYYYLRNLGIKVNPINTNEVISGVCGHSIVIATFKTIIGEKIFLLDPTYLQFFCKENCDISKYVVINNIVCVSPDPGYFIAKSNKEDVILPLLQNGYTELREEVAKVYGDSFFQTKQGTLLEQVKNNVTSGLNYIRWFKHYTSKLSKTKEELANMDLLIESAGNSYKNRII